MKISNNNINLNFYGYKNLLSNTLRSFQNDTYSHVCLELDNNQSADLDKWYKIQDKLMPNQEKTKYLVMHDISSNNNVLFIGNEKKNINLNINKINSKNREVMLETYTFLASILKRIALNPINNDDKNLIQTFIHLYKNLNTIFETNLADRLANETLMRRTKPEITVEIFRNTINNNMRKYFKL